MQPPAITTSRAAQPGASRAERGAGITDHHDLDIRIVSKPPRWPGSAKITAVPGSHAAAANTARPYGRRTLTLGLPMTSRTGGTRPPPEPRPGVISTDT